MKDEITQSEFNRLSLDIEVNVRLTTDDYNTLLLKNPNSHEILLGYATFLDICLNDPVEADKNYRKSEELRAIQDHQHGSADGGGAAGSSLFTIQENGLIERYILNT